jgi:flagellin
LSSGLRINSAKDDAAGQAIANRMSSQITGLSQAQRNANDGISVAQTAEGALNQVNDNVQRIRELSVQAANGTNSQDDLQSIQDEVGQRLAEIDRISGETNFNGVKVLAEDQGINIQVGANDGEAISVNLQEINAETLGLNNLDLRNQVTSASLSEVGANVTEAVAATTVELTYTGATPAAPTYVVGDDGNLLADVGGTLYDATFDSANNTVSYDSSGTASTALASTSDSYVDGNGDVVELADLNGGGAIADDAAAPSFDIYTETAGAGVVAWDGTDSYTMGANGNSIDYDTGVVTLGTADGAAVTITDYDQATTGNVLTVAGTSEVATDMTTVDSTLDEGTNTLMTGEDGAYYVRNENGDDTTYYSATVDQASGEVTLGDLAPVDPLKSIDAALNQVDSFRSELGAVQNRFESAITNLSTNETNLSAARSRIEDADYAVEVANMTRAQILQQAGTSVLAQANQIPQNVLSLLG